MRLREIATGAEKGTDKCMASNTSVTAAKTASRMWTQMLYNYTGWKGLYNHVVVVYQELHGHGQVCPSP